MRKIARHWTEILEERGNVTSGETRNEDSRGKGKGSVTTQSKRD